MSARRRFGGRGEPRPEDRPTEVADGPGNDNYDVLNEQAAVQERAVSDLEARMDLPEPLSNEVLRARLDEAEAQIEKD